MQEYDFCECICEIRDRLSKTRKIWATYDGIEGEITSLCEKYDYEYDKIEIAGIFLDIIEAYIEITSLRGLREIADIAISVAQNIC